MASVLPFSALKPSSNQVAGHQFEEGHPGSLVDDSGCFYKPLQNGERGEREIKFYETFWADERVPVKIKEFFPKYHGCVLVEKQDGTGSIKHAVLEDVTKGFENPCVMDIKMGYQTWYPEASKEYIQKSKKKDEESTTSSLGMRISGMQVYEPGSLRKWKADRNWCRTLDTSGFYYAIRRFVSTNPSEGVPDAPFTSDVYGQAIPQLRELMSWFETQTYYHFFSSSILIIYEGGHKSPVRIKLVDFAHVTEEHQEVDESYLKALKTLILLLESEMQP